MASIWRYSVTLVDTKALKTVLNFIGEFDGLSLTDEFGLAETAAGDLLTDLKAVTDAAVFKTSLALLQEEGEALPADADVTDEAAIVTWLSDVDALPKYHTIRIPAPIDMFQSDEVTVDKTNANLIAYIANFGGSGYQVSDGEYVVTSRENGISHGFWRSRAKSTNPA